MRNSWCSVVSVISLGAMLAWAAGCGEDDPPPPPPPPTAVTGPQAQGNQPSPSANQAQGAATSNFGTITLNPGFTPDPHVVQGSSGGAIQAETLDASCKGWVSQIPDHLFVAGGAFGNLRFLANGGADDLTLVVQRPDGSFACNDDAEGRNPIVQGNFNAGQYKIWIGSYNQGVQARYNLGISELASTSVADIGSPGGGGAGGEMASNFGTVSLSPGFTPDPHVVNGTSGGAIQASTWQAGCTGWVSQTPDHILSLGGHFSLLRVLVNSRRDTTVVVQKPDGTYLCNDDTEGRNPVIAGSFPPGNYKVWVGSYRQGQTSSYHLGFSELADTRTRQIR